MSKFRPLYGRVMRTYRLTNESQGLGLSCTAAGLSFAGTPLLRRTDRGFAPRPRRSDCWWKSPMAPMPRRGGHNNILA